ncbi:MAG: hypothetical protein H0V52_01575 [Acidimicrobiia bacterium]|nr:hypothetical protein [Acidimicrobiia bacterium]
MSAPAVWWPRASARLERATGYPGWSMVGVVGGLVVMGVAMVGLYWDVAWHVDFGRDTEAFTMPHLLVVVGQLALVGVAIVTVLCATADAAPVRLRLWGLRIPWSAVLLVAFRLGGSVAFALDDLWHRSYGLDVTLWSPPHLMLLAGGALSSVAIWLMLVEAGPVARPTALGRAIHVVACASILVGVSTAQGEFDFGVPLARVLVLPVLVMASAGFVLVLSRLALGPGGALKVVATFVVLRVAVALVVGAGLDHSVPHFALYLAPALAVELVAARLGTSRRLRFATGAGLAVATVGLAGEWAWAATANGHHLAVAAWPLVLTLAVTGGVAGSILGAGLARVVPGGTTIGRTAMIGAALALAVALAVPLPRQVGDVEAVLRLEAVGEQRALMVELSPPEAAEGADIFDVLSVHGGARVVTELEADGPGRYLSAAGVPVSGSWKTVVRLYRGDEVMAVPVHLPADPSIGAPEVPAVPERRVAFVDVNDLLLREVHDGPAAVAWVVFAGLALVLGVWLVLLHRVTRALQVQPVRETSTF